MAQAEVGTATLELVRGDPEEVERVEVGEERVAMWQREREGDSPPRVGWSQKTRLRNWLMMCGRCEAQHPRRWLITSLEGRQTRIQDSCEAGVR